ncbi:unnamed protein product [Paramecium sonneborni]|uniref:Uncharacterized protein n=1 Tax=Paramecium sonneborni TaxID=65129 RepID=A0A8S1RLE0_9CILI|nr:unnamed protein product [Paramecium sonneborni]
MLNMFNDRLKIIVQLIIRFKWTSTRLISTKFSIGCHNTIVTSNMKILYYCFQINTMTYRITNLQFHQLALTNLWLQQNICIVKKRCQRNVGAFYQELLRFLKPLDCQNLPLNNHQGISSFKINTLNNLRLKIQIFQFEPL